MKITGIIAEFNPLHYGHIYHMNETRRLSGADGIVVVMSGDFVQRGEPAMTDKYLRTKNALLAGADAVFELPVRYACSSAGTFAEGGVSALNSLGAVSGISFGCEDADLDALMNLATFLEDEPEEYRELLLGNIRQGMNFAKARGNALSSVLPPSISTLLDKPNNILAVEYLRAMSRSSSKLVPYAVARTGKGHNESASAIRRELLKRSCGTRPCDLSLSNPYRQDRTECIKDMEPCDLTLSNTCRQDRTECKKDMEPCDFSLSNPTKTDEMPEASVLQAMLPGYVQETLSHPLFPDDFSALLLYRLRLFSDDELSLFDDISPELAKSIKKASSSANSFSELVHGVSSRTYTNSRIRRALIHILLDLRKHVLSAETYTGEVSAKPAPMKSGLRLLGFRRGTQVLRAIQDAASIPIITKAADAPEGCLDEDILAADIYRLAYMERFKETLPDEYHQGPVMV